MSIVTFRSCKHAIMQACKHASIVITYHLSSHLCPQATDCLHSPSLTMSCPSPIHASSQPTSPTPPTAVPQEEVSYTQPPDACSLEPLKPQHPNHHSLVHTPLEAASILTSISAQLPSSSHPPTQSSPALDTSGYPHPVLRSAVPVESEQHPAVPPTPTYATTDPTPASTQRPLSSLVELGQVPAEPPLSKTANSPPPDAVTSAQTVASPVPTAAPHCNVTASPFVAMGAGASALPATPCSASGAAGTSSAQPLQVTLMNQSNLASTSQVTTPSNLPAGASFLHPVSSSTPSLCAAVGSGAEAIKHLPKAGTQSPASMHVCSC